MKTKVHIQMFGTYENYDALVNMKEFARVLEYCDNFFRITDLNTNKEIFINPKSVAWIECEEVKE